MSSVLADFTAHVTAETAEWNGAVQARVLLGGSQLVLAAGEDDRVTVPLDAVFDVTVDSPPRFVDPMPGTPVTVAFRAGGDRATAVVSTDEEEAERFRVLLFTAVLNGTSVTLKHPAKVGGRVLDTAFAASVLSIRRAGVRFDTDEGPVSIPLDAVVDFDRESRTVEGVERPTLVVTHVDSGEALTTLAATESGRKLSLLGRYIRHVYRTVVESLRRLDLSDRETETLTTLYSVGDTDVSLPGVLDAEPRAVRRLLHALHDKGLVESGDHGPVLTAKGRIVVNQYLERVNA